MWKIGSCTTSLLVILGCAAMPSVLQAQEGAKEKEKKPGWLERLLTGGAYKPKALPGGKDAVTTAKLIAQRKTWLAQLMVRSYEKHGVRDGRWDDAMRRALPVFARIHVGATYSDVALRNRFHQDLRIAYELGCDDPLARFASGSLVFMTGETETAQKLISAAAPELEKRGYPAYFSFLAYQRLAQIQEYERKPKTAKQTDLIAEDYLVRAAAEEHFGNGNERFFLDAVQSHWTAGVANAERFVQKLEKQKGANPYALNVTRGKHQIAKAWRARGGGLAHTVTDEGWRVFARELAKGRRYLTEAWQKYPHHPEAAALMITICMAGHGTLTERQWFDRAVAAQFDYWDAYSRYLNGIQPKWGGSVQELMNFGAECILTKRFETVVPLAFDNAFYYMSSALRDWRQPLKSPAIRSYLTMLHEGRMLHTKTMAAADNERSRQVFLELASGQKKAAAKRLQELGTKFNTNAFNLFRIKKEQIEKELKPHFAAGVVPRLSRSRAFEGFEDAVYVKGYEPKPIPTGADVGTEKSFRENREAWLAKKLVADYRDFGRTKRDWDREVESVLDRYPTFRVGAPDEDPLVKTAYLRDIEALLARDCDDALFRYVAGSVFYLCGDTKRGLEEVERARKALPTTRYPNLYAFFAARKHARMLQGAGRKKDAAKVGEEIRPRLIAAAADGSFGDGQQRHFFREVALGGGSIGYESPRDADNLIRMLEAQKGVDPWILAIVTGAHHVKLAWDAHREPWQKANRDRFRKHVDIARANLMKAYELHPEFPEAAAGMIVVRMLSGGAGNVRQWFERAVAAQFDYHSAYRNFMWALRPEWGGSWQAKLKFGVEAAETGRHDTNVPMQLLEACFYIAKEQREWRAVFTAPGIHERITKCLDHAAARPNRSLTDTSVESQQAVLAWAAGKYAQAKAQFDELGATFQASWLKRYKLDRKVIDADLALVPSAK